MDRRGVISKYVLILGGLGGLALVACVVLVVLTLSGGTEDVLKLAVWRFRSADSFHVDADFQYHGTSGKVSVFNDVQWTSGGDFDRRTDVGRSTNDFTLRLGAAGSPLIASGRVARQADLNLVTVAQIPDRLGALNLQVFRGKTMRVDLDKTLASLPSLPFVGGLRLSDADVAELTDAAAATPFLTIKQKLANEPVGGVESLHYKGQPDMTAVRDLLKRVEAKRLGHALDAKELAKYDALLAEYVAEDGELWLGSGNYLPQRLRLVLRQDGLKRKGTWTLTLNFSRYNQVPAIADLSLNGVEDAAPYLDSLLAVYTSHLPMAKTGLAKAGGTTSAGLPVETVVVSAVDVDDDGLPFMLENFYGSDSLNPDSDGDGFRDGQEVDDTRSPMGPWNLFDFTQGQFD